MIREVNINFEARQAVIYKNTNEAFRLIGDKFLVFDQVLAICDNALIKTSKEIEDEKLALIADIDNKISELQEQKDALTKSP